ncbi:tetratricopeptide repeat protein [Brucepastera parasyntrophica]|uniref:tetratricopeptide repeat protein n=1 Tax=Brucepastera parasyntrophica TaxID=2880008 RepID=UPI00210AEBE1|nr:tetratricopeptide repeat protein [Brucepastera parasyntrophica]ULQ60140.1 tetratricopeptide repeat protein [Brucepastera parasyntrophica]
MIIHDSGNKKNIVRLFFLAVCLLQIGAYDYFTEGERLFRENKPDEAVPLLFQALQQPDADPKAYIYLGLCYQQLGKYPDAISTFTNGTAVQGADRKLLYFNAGNVYFLQELFPEAESMYSQALQADSNYAPAYLNRANARMSQGKHDDAVSDYQMYLVLDPSSWQKDAIQRLISLVQADQQRQRDAALRAEAERAAAEAEKKAAEERYRQMLDSVSSSLQSIDGASVMSAGSEDVMGYDEEGSLE